MRPALSVILLLACSAWAKTVSVSLDSPLSSIQEAIRVAEPEDTIEVQPGVYIGNVSIDKPVTLKGFGKPVIHGSGTGSTVRIVAPGVTLDGFVVEHSGGALVAEDSGVLLRAAGSRIVNNELRDILFGIYFYQAHHSVVAGNVIRGRRELEVGERGAGIHIWDSSDNVIEDNIVTDVRDGMYLQNADRSRIRRNRVFGVRYGLHYMYSNDNAFEDNVFENNIAGAAIMYSHNIDFRRNVFRHNRGFASFGILFQGSENCRAERNIIVANAVGIFLEALHGSVFKENLIGANDTAIQLFASATGNDFTRNNFVGNLSPIYVIGKNSRTNWSREGAGNYWSDYDGYDLDADGIGDVPFRIQNLFERLEGNHPRLRLYFYSPASQALAAAERTFPIIPGAEEIDRHPLMKPVKIDMPASSETPRRTGVLGIAFSAAVLLLGAGAMVWGRHK